MLKYTLTDETRVADWHILHRIQYSDGSKGGWLESESNLDQLGLCRVDDDACVFGNARVYGDAVVYGDTWVSGNALVYGNARVYGNVWVCEDARVYGDAVVYGDTWVCGNAQVFDNTWVDRAIQVYGYFWVSE